MDELFVKAGRLIIDSQKASIGRIQRELKIGYNAAILIMDQLEAAGVIGAEIGTKPREILMNSNQFEEYVSKHSEPPMLKKVINDESGKDLLFADAGKFVINQNRASIGAIQRAFMIGFDRAARIMDQLEEANVVGSKEETGQLKILMTEEQFENYLIKNSWMPKTKERVQEEQFQEKQTKKFTALVCERCGGTLSYKDKVWVCQSCGTSFIRE